MAKKVNKEIVNLIEDMVRLNTEKSSKMEQKLILRQAKSVLDKYVNKKTMEEIVDEELSKVNTSVIEIPGFPSIDIEKHLKIIDEMIEDNARSVEAFGDTIAGLIPVLVTLAVAAV